MKNEDVAKRSHDVSYMISTDGWKLWFEPEIFRMVEKYNKIDMIDERDLHDSFMKNKIRRDVYSGLLNKLKEWVSLKEGVQNGKEQK